MVWWELRHSGSQLLLFLGRRQRQCKGSEKRIMMCSHITENRIKILWSISIFSRFLFILSQFAPPTRQHSKFWIFYLRALAYFPHPKYGISSNTFTFIWVRWWGIERINGFVEMRRASQSKSDVTGFRTFNSNNDLRMKIWRKQNVEWMNDWMIRMMSECVSDWNIITGCLCWIDEETSSSSWISHSALMVGPTICNIHSCRIRIPSATIKIDYIFMHVHVFVSCLTTLLCLLIDLTHLLLPLLNRADFQC